MLLPEGLDYSNRQLIDWSLPALDRGTYTSISVLVFGPGDYVVDSAAWDFIGGAASQHRVVLLERALKRLGELDLSYEK